MNVVDFVQMLYELDVRLWTEGDRLRYAAPAGVITKELLSGISENKPAIIALLQKVSTANRSPASIGRAPREEPLPLSYAQQGLWFLDKVIPEKAAYNISFLTWIRGLLDSLILEKSLNEVLTRHENLRTIFPEIEGRPRQSILSDAHVRIILEDRRLDHLTDDEVRTICRSEADVPFDLSRDLLVRAKLFHLANDYHLLSLVIHHIVADGISLGILLREFVTTYEHLSRDQRPVLADLPVQYADFSWDQRNSLTDEVLKEGLGYWQKQLSDLVPSQFPTDGAKPEQKTFRGATESHFLSQALTDRLKCISREERIPVFVTLLSAFLILVSRYSGQEDVAVGVPVATRDHASVEGLIGFFVNTVVLRVKISANLTFKELLAKTRQTMAEAYTHRHVPFEKVVASLQVSRDLTENPIFQVMFASQNPPREPSQMGDCSLETEIGSNNTARFHLCMYVQTDGDVFRLRCEYSSDLFNASTIIQLMDRFENLLQAISANKEERVSRLPVFVRRNRKPRLDKGVVENLGHLP